MRAPPTSGAPRSRGWGAEVLARFGNTARLVAVGMLLTAFLVLFVFPTRSLLAQRSELNDGKRELEVVSEQNHRLELERQKLQSSGEIERLARALHNMIWPGETPYVVVPPPADPDGAVTPTSVAP